MPHLLSASLPLHSMHACVSMPGVCWVSAGCVGVCVGCLCCLWTWCLQQLLLVHGQVVGVISMPPLAAPVDPSCVPACVGILGVCCVCGVCVLAVCG